VFEIHKHKIEQSHVCLLHIPTTYIKINDVRHLDMYNNIIRGIDKIISVKPFIYK
jgi:hypothetical protein